jgi:hypothetical protein
MKVYTTMACFRDGEDGYFFYYFNIHLLKRRAEEEKNKINKYYINLLIKPEPTYSEGCSDEEYDKYLEDLKNYEEAKSYVHTIIHTQKLRL